MLQMNFREAKSQHSSQELAPYRSDNEAQPKAKVLLSNLLDPTFSFYNIFLPGESLFEICEKYFAPPSVCFPGPLRCLSSNTFFSHLPTAFSSSSSLLATSPIHHRCYRYHHYHHCYHYRHRRETVSRLYWQVPQVCVPKALSS